MNVAELIEQLNERDPKARVVIDIFGAAFDIDYLDDNVVTTKDRNGTLALLPKPL